MCTALCRWIIVQQDVTPRTNANMNHCAGGERQCIHQPNLATNKPTVQVQTEQHKHTNGNQTKLVPNSNKQ